MIWAFILTHRRWFIAGGALLAILAALILLVMGVRGMIDDARSSGLKQGRAEIQSKWDAQKAGAATARAELSSALAEAFNGLDASNQAVIRSLHATGQTLRIQVDKEMGNDPRYVSADCSLGDGVRAKIDAARALSRPGAASPVHSGGVPAGGAAVRLEFGDVGAR